MESLHHVSILTRDLDRSRAFFRDVLGLRETQRPAFRSAGAWFTLEDGELHVNQHPTGTFRSVSTVDNDDGHIALRVADFDTAIARLAAHGHREDAPDGDPMRLVVNRNSAAGYPQAYLLDPDWNVIEINAERR